MNYPLHAYILQAPKQQFEDLALAFAGDVMQPDVAGLLRLQKGHLDFLRIRPDGAAIKIAQVRDCLQTLSSRPYEGGRRVVAFLSADKMTPSAQNCLLKTLEEPPPGTSFLLLCERAANLLPTVASRCAMLASPHSPAEDESQTLAFLSSVASCDALEAASRLPQEREALQLYLSSLLEGLDALIHANAQTPSRLRFYSRCISPVHRAHQMLEHNVNAPLCAQWLCIQLKEVNNDHGRWS